MYILHEVPGKTVAMHLLLYVIIAINITVGQDVKVCKNPLGIFKCRYLKQHMACRTHRDRMEIYCPLECGFCGSSANGCAKSLYGCCPDGVTAALWKNYGGCKEPCKDDLKSTICKALNARGYCRYSRYSTRCMKTCKLCRECNDVDDMECNMIVTNNLCSKMPRIAMNKCRKSCHLCGRSDPCTMFSCANGTKCQVDNNGQAYCPCLTKCSNGDHSTGYVCGRDNKSYSSLCKLKQKSCIKSAAVVVKYYGMCYKRISRRNSRKDVGTLSCERSKHGCCLDGKTIAIDVKASNCAKDCPKDYWGTFCKRFTAVCGNERNELTMKHRCATSCMYCLS